MKFYHGIYYREVLHISNYKTSVTFDRIHEKVLIFHMGFKKVSFIFPLFIQAGKCTSKAQFHHREEYCTVITQNNNCQITCTSDSRLPKAILLKLTLALGESPLSSSAPASSKSDRLAGFSRTSFGSDLSSSSMGISPSFSRACSSAAWSGASSFSSFSIVSSSSPLSPSGSKSPSVYGQREACFNIYMYVLQLQLHTI